MKMRTDTGCFHKISRQGGVSIIELLLYIVVVSVFVAFIFSLYRKSLDEANAQADAEDVRTILDIANSTTISQIDYASLSSASLTTFKLMQALPPNLNSQTAIFTGRSGQILSVSVGHSVPSEPTWDTFSVTSTGVPKSSCFQTIPLGGGLYNVTVNGVPLPYSSISGYQVPDWTKVINNGICSSTLNTIVFTEIKSNNFSAFRVSPAGTMMSPSPPISVLTPGGVTVDTWVQSDYNRQQAAAAARLALQSSL